MDDLAQYIAQSRAQFEAQHPPPPPPQPSAAAKAAKAAAAQAAAEAEAAEAKAKAAAEAEALEALDANVAEEELVQRVFQLDRELQELQWSTAEQIRVCSFVLFSCSCSSDSHVF